jgi:hypothetical protein
MTTIAQPVTTASIDPDLVVYPAESHSCYPLALRAVTDPDEVAVGVCTRGGGQPATWTVLDERMAREVHAYLTQWIAARDLEAVPEQTRRRMAGPIRRRRDHD